MSDPILAGGQAAVGSLKSAQNIGKQLGAVVGDQQADMERAVQQQHIQRLQAKAKEKHLENMADYRAFEAYEKEVARQKELDLLKQQALKKYGRNAWSEVEATKAKLERERKEEEKYMDKDRQKVQQLFWWCMTASALITYFFKLYK
jgi:hypothetical protein